MKSSTHLKSLLLATTLHAGVAFAADRENRPIQLFMPDGQLKSHPIRIFVEHDLTEAMKPELSFVRLRPLFAKENGGKISFQFKHLARNQKWIQKHDGQDVSVTGTLLIFDLGQKFSTRFYQAVQRVTPVLTWKESADDRGEPELQTAIGEREVYLGSLAGALGWTTLTVVGLIGSIAIFCHLGGKKAWHLFISPDGHLSLWRAQLAAWTVAIGAVVFCFGLTQLELPKIPESLVALMGLSLATGGFSYLGAQSSVEISSPARQAPVKELKFPEALGDLVREYSSDSDEGQFSIAKAQMLFWTVLMLALFIIKGIQESKPWEVPWEMVALMGMSQAGYVGPKFFKKDSTPTNIKDPVA